MTRPTNVLFILSDEHAPGVLGCAGHPVVKTPILDALAARGTRFRNAYTPSPICIPARASLATGLPVFQHRCWSSAEPYRGQHQSWMHRLRDAGSEVVSIGKLHFRSSKDDNGFSEERLGMYLANGGKGWPQGLLRNPMPSYPEAAELAADIGPGETDYTDYDRRITAEACSWLRSRPGAPSHKPWVLSVSYICPHYPLSAPREFYDWYEGIEIPAPIAEGTPPDHSVLREMLTFWDYDRHFDEDARRRGRRNYFALCSFVDDNIRQVLAALEESGAAEETLVIYASDHGEMLGDQGFWTKSVMYEGSAGIPVLMAGPEVPAAVNDTPVSLTDVAATIETAVGLSPRPAVADWVSRPLQGLIARPEPDRPILSEYHDGGSPTGVFMLRKGPWKYVHYAGRHRPQLFNLDSDSCELKDLGTAREHAATRDQLSGVLRSILDPEAVNRAAFADQAKLLAQYGGREGVLAMKSFNHTPLAEAAG